VYEIFFLKFLHCFFYYLLLNNTSLLSALQKTDIEVITINSDQHQVAIASKKEQTMVLYCETSTVITLMVEDYSTLELVILGNVDLPQQSIELNSTIGSEAKLHCYPLFIQHSDIAFGCRNEVIGHNGHSDVHLITHVVNNQTASMSCTNVFNANGGTGEMTMKGVAEDTAILNYEGLIDIGLKGGGTDTYLTQEALMLDTTATVNAIPGLEIKTNDVKASHSATVAKVTDEDLFYFGSRGINKETARAMFVEGFLMASFDGVNSSILKSALLATAE
jgi:hypothetical protein